MIDTLSYLRQRGLLSFIAVGLLPLALQPQVTLAQDNGNTSEPVVLKGIVVEASKRGQASFDTIGGVGTVATEDLLQRNFDNVGDIDRALPDIHIRQRSSRAYSNVTIRGQYSTDFYNPSAQLYVDGLPQDQTLLMQLLPNSLDRVEVLYGPQGTLYGRGAIGGVINLVTVKPDNTFHVSAAGSVDSLGRDGGFRVSTPIIDNALYGDLSFTGDFQKGEMEDMNTGERIGDSENYFGQGRLRYAPSDSPLDVMASFSRSVRHSEEEHFIRADQLEDRIAVPVPSDYDLSSNNYGLIASYDFDRVTLTSSTGYQDRKLDRLIFANYTPEWQETFSQEVRISSQPEDGNTIDYVTGLYFQNLDFQRLVPAFALSSNQVIKSYAAYGELTWHVNDDLDLLAGLRFDREDVEVDTVFGALALSNEDDFSAVSPKVGASYMLTDELKVYALFSSGFKAGGFTRAVSPANISFSYDPQRTYNYEVGLKSTLLNGALQVDTSIYFTKTDDYQLSVGPIGAGQFLQNVGEVKSKGADLKVTWLPTDAVAVNAGVAVNDTYFSAYSNPFNPADDLTDNTVPYAPNVTANLGASYTADMPMGMGELTARAGMTFVGETFFDEANTIRQGSYALFDAGLTWRKADYLSMDLFVDNITDKTYAVYGFDASGQGLGDVFQVGEGRTFGGRVKIRY